MKTEKLEKYRAKTAGEVMLADTQRHVWASHLAECELGPMPITPKERDDYIDRHNKLSRLILSRLN
jgi:hypothetical protein